MRAMRLSGSCLVIYTLTVYIHTDILADDDLPGADLTFWVDEQ